MKTAFLLFFIILLYSVTAKAQTTFNKLNVKDLNVNGNIQVVSTTQASTPCPEMTEAQRDAIPSPVLGNCVTNSDTLALNVYNGTIWKAAGGGGVNQWLTSTGYNVDDVVIESFKFYVCLIAHTSGTFATDLAGLNWQEVSPGLTGVITMANGGTDKALTPVLGGIVYTDAGSMEVLSPGTAGQIQQTNGGAAPTWVNKSISGKAQSLTAQTVEEIQVPGSLLTETAAGKYLNETGNLNLLANPSFEHSTTASGWTSSVTSTATATYGTGSTTTKELGSKQGTFSCAGGASGGTCLFYQNATTSKVIQGLVLAYVSTTNAAATQVYSRVNGSNNKSITLQQTSEQLYKIPEIIGSTSTGIAVLVTVPASTTYTGTIDGAFVGAVDLKQDVDQSRIAGESYFAGTASCGPARTSTTIGAFTASAACPGPTIVNSSMGSWQTTDADLMKQTINNLPAGTYKAKFFFRLTLATSGNTGFAINDGTTTCEPVYGPTGGIGQYTQTVVECAFVYTSAGNRTFELYGGSSANAITLSNDTVTPRVSTKFILEYFGSSSVYTANCGANCVDTFSAKISTTDVVTDENSDFINGACTDATTGEQTCTFNTGIFSVAPNCECTVSVAGGTSDQTCSIGSISNTTILLQTKSNNVMADRDVILSCQKTGSDFSASRSIIGTFNEVVTSPGVSKPKTCQYAFGGASATLALPTTCAASPCVELYDSCGVITAPTRNANGDYTIAIANGTFAASAFVKCDYQCGASGGSRNCNNYSQGSMMITNASGGLSPTIISTNQAGTASDAYITLECKGQAP